MSTKVKLEMFDLDIEFPKGKGKLVENNGSRLTDNHPILESTSTTP